MSDKDETIRKGQHASRILADPIVKQAFADIRANIYKGIEHSSFGQKNEREDAYRMLRAVTALEGELERYITKAKGIRAEEEADATVVLNLSEH